MSTSSSEPFAPSVLVHLDVSQFSGFAMALTITRKTERGSFAVFQTNSNLLSLLCNPLMSTSIAFGRNGHQAPIRQKVILPRLAVATDERNVSDSLDAGCRPLLQLVNAI
jgi:hypothetical protein